MARTTSFHKSSAIRAALEAAGGDASKVFRFDTKGRGKKSKYISIFVNVGNGWVRLNNIQFLNEIHRGTIKPKNAADLVAFNENRGDFGVTEVRDRDPVLSVTRYKERVETDDNAAPTGPLPDESEMSDLFYVMEKFQSVFEAKYREWKLSGHLYDNTTKDYLQNGVPPGAIRVDSMKYCAPIQTHISDKATRNAGVELVNAILRLTLPFDRVTGMAKAGFVVYDKTKPIVTDQGARAYEEVTFGGEPLTADNVHNLKSGAQITGFVSMDAICCSLMGVSAPRKITTLVIDAPVAAASAPTLGDLFGSGAFGDEDDVVVAAPATADAADPVAAPVVAPVAAPVVAPVAAAPAEAPAADVLTADAVANALAGL